MYTSRLGALDGERARGWLRPEPLKHKRVDRAQRDAPSERVGQRPRRRRSGVAAVA